MDTDTARAPLKVRVGRVLKKYREAKGITQEAIAATLEMHRVYYSAIERGRKDVRLETLDRVCDALDLKPSQVLDEAGA